MGTTQQDARVDVMFRRTGDTAEGVLTLADPPLVNELNGAFTIERIAWHGSAGLEASGAIAAGKNAVFELAFTDHGDISVLRTDDKPLSLRAELGPGGKVLRGMLGSVSGQVADGFLSYRNDEFVAGSWELLYDGPSLVVGRVDMQFRKYRVMGNFRAPRVR